MEHNAFWYRKNHLGVLIALIFFGLAACQDETDCTTDSTNRVVIEFIKLANEGRQQPADVIDNIEVFREGSNVPLIASGTNAIGIPLDPASNSTKVFIFREIGNTFTTDTLVINYQREQTLVTPECGPDQRFFGLSIDEEQSSFDSTRLREPETSQSPEGANFQVYTCRYEMTNRLQLRLNYSDNDDEITDTLIINRIFSDVGKQEDLRQNDSIPENSDVTVSVPVDREREQVTVFVEIEGDAIAFREVNVLYSLDTFQVPTCLAQDRYRLDSVWVTDTLRLFNPELTEETLNINNPTNAQVSIR